MKNRTSNLQEHTAPTRDPRDFQITMRGVDEATVNFGGNAENKTE